MEDEETEFCEEGTCVCATPVADVEDGRGPFGSALRGGPAVEPEKRGNRACCELGPCGVTAEVDELLPPPMIEGGGLLPSGNLFGLMAVKICWGSCWFRARKR